MSRIVMRPYTAGDEKGFGIGSSHELTFGSENSGGIVAVYPMGGRLVSRYSLRDRTNAFWAVVDVELLKVEEPKLTEMTFRVSPASPTARVGDERLRIGYELGSTLVNLDGRQLETHIPINEDLSTRLDWWVENGKLGPVPMPESHADDSTP